MGLASCPTPRGHRLTADGYRPLPCRRLSCGWCGPRVALSTVKAIELAAPNASGVLALPLSEMTNGDPSTLRAFASTLREVARDLRGRGLSWEYTWIVERSESGTAHVHLLQHGSRVTGPAFAAAARRAGAWGDLQEIRHPPRVVRYVLKLPLSVLDLGHDRPEDVMALHLMLNGNALLHASRRFWRDSEGSTLRGLRAARAAARTRSGRPAPSREQLAAWRAGWKLPPIPVGLGGPRGELKGLASPPSEGEGRGEESRPGPGA
jgi:hypothetical protein